MSEKRTDADDRTSAVRLGVFVVEPFAVVRAGLVRTIDESPGLEVLGSAASASETMDVVGRLDRSRVVILVAMGLAGEQDAYWLIRALRERSPGHVILGMGANADRTRSPGPCSRAPTVSSTRTWRSRSSSPLSGLRARRRW